MGDLRKIRAFLFDIREKWYDIGIELDVDVEMLDKIQYQNPDSGICLRELIKTRLKYIDPVLTWKVIEEALRASPVNEVALADEASLKGNPQQEGARGGEEKTPQHALTNEQATLEIEDEKTPIEGYKKKFPYLVVRDLSLEDKEMLIADLEVESENIHLKFASLVVKVEKSLERSDVTIENLASFFEFGGLKELANNVKSADTISEVMKKVTQGNYWTFFNYILLENLIAAFCRDEMITTDLNMYVTDIESYCKRRLYEVPITALKNHIMSQSADKKSQLCIKLDENFSVSFNNIKRIQNRLSKLLGIKYLYLVDVNDGCIELTFRFFQKVDAVLTPELVERELAKINAKWIRIGRVTYELAQDILENMHERVRLTTKNIKEVRGFLYEVRFKWYDIGLELEVPIEKLDHIKDQYKDDGRCLLEMLKVWFLMTSANHLPTWKELANALAARPVDEMELSEKALLKENDSNTREQTPTDSGSPPPIDSIAECVESTLGDNSNTTVTVFEKRERDTTLLEKEDSTTTVLEKSSKKECVEEAIPVWKVGAINNHPSFHGYMDGDVAETKLLEQNHSCYLTRYSVSREDHTLSVLRKKEEESVFQNFSIIIRKEEEERKCVTFEISGSEEWFKDIDEMLAFYKRNPLNHSIDAIGEEVVRDFVSPQSAEHDDTNAEKSSPALEKQETVEKELEMEYRSLFESSNTKTEETARIRKMRKLKSRMSKDGLNSAVPRWALQAMNNHPSFHGSIARTEAIIQLIESGRSCYLTRYSRYHTFCVISVLRISEDGELLQHLKLDIDTKQNKYQVQGLERRFSDITDLLSYYQKNPVRNYPLGECLTSNIWRSLDLAVGSMQPSSLPEVPEKKEEVALQDMSHPTISNLTLIRWKDDNEQYHDFKLLEQVGQRWWKAGMLLSLKPTTLDKYRDRAKNDFESCQHVFSKWIRSNGHKEYPLTWVGLYTLLVDMGRRTAAEKLYDVLKSTGTKYVDTLCTVLL